MTGSGSRRKGHDFERWVARRFCQAGLPARRMYQYRFGQDGADVEVGGKGERWWVECKRGRKVNFRAALAQAIRDKRDGQVPLVIAKDDGEQPIAMMLLEDWLKEVIP